MTANKRSGLRNVKSNNKHVVEWIHEQKKHIRKSPPPYNKNDFIYAITMCKGNVSAIADAIGVDRHVAKEFIDNDPQLSQLLASARERRIDQLEDHVLERAIHERDSTLQIFLLRTQGRHRGYDQSSDAVNKEVLEHAFSFVMNKTANPVDNKSSEQ